jgi:ATP-dependent Lhr-like helicase
MTRTVLPISILPAPPPSPETALRALADPLRCWFRDSFVQPTAAQRFAWPALADRHNLLLCAPTGSGKTLAAFLPVLSHLVGEPLAAGVRCLYLAPLKALGNDAARNLRAYLRGLRPFLSSGPPLRTGVRTGDTSARMRQAQRLRPPEILLTTPESLAVLLSQPFAAEFFRNLAWVVVDEVHALVGNKRGADLALSLERLTDLAIGSVQRIGLSATCAPLAEVAAFLVGADRACSVACVEDATPLTLTVEPIEPDGGFLPRLVERLTPELAANRTTLIFTNTRGLAERLTWALVRRFPEWTDQIAVHHSSLAAGRRRAVERRLKHGFLRAVVSSTSLELGVDIGSVDAVVLVHPPGGVVRLLQRVGRAGHGPGRIRRGLVLTASAGELLEATVTAASGRDLQLEASSSLAQPLDVLCQQLLGMAAQRPWSADGAFALVRQAYPYRDLPRDDFDDCLDYLSGRRRDGRGWLPSRLCWFGPEFSILDERTACLLRRNLGTILSEQYRAVRLREGPAVGEVTQDFADRLQPGDRFLLDGRCLEVRGSEDRAILVDEVVGRPAVPRWGGEVWPLSSELARRLYVCRIRAAEALRDGPDALLSLLERDYRLDRLAAGALLAYFQQQESVSEIPDLRTCLVEVVPGEVGPVYYVHTPLNPEGNDVLVRLAVLRLARDCGRGCGSVTADLGFALLLQEAEELTPDRIHTLLSSDRLEADLDEAIAGSMALRERFRRVAQTGLMLLRNPIGRRSRVGGRDWAERRLFDRIRETAPGFVLLRQAAREVRGGAEALEAARQYLTALPRLMLRCRRLAQISPFAESWTHLAAGPMETVEPLHGSLVNAVGAQGA